MSKMDSTIKLTTDIVSAYVSRSKLPLAGLSDLIHSVHDALVETGKPRIPVTAQHRTVPAVPIKRSIERDYIICLEDGRRLRTLKRHLRTAFNMTPEQYRAKWNLPDDYPMVAQSTSEARSKIAKDTRLGQNGRKRAADKVTQSRNTGTSETDRKTRSKPKAG